MQEICAASATINVVHLNVPLNVSIMEWGHTTQKVYAELAIYRNILMIAGIQIKKNNSATITKLMKNLRLKMIDC